MSSDCQHVRELMDSYLSGELSVETNHLVLRHVEGCRTCGGELTRRQRLRTLLAQALDIPMDGPRATERIVHAVDRQQRSWGRMARWSGMAAALLLVVIAAAQWFARPVDAAAYDDSVGNHIACALATPDIAYDAERVARSLVSPYEHIAEAIGLAHGDYRVIDAHMCPYRGRDYAHVVLRGEGRTVSVFVEPEGRGDLPPAPVTTPLLEGATDVRSTSRSGYRVSAAATSGYRMYVVSERAADEPDEITSELLQSTVRFVRGLAH